jgi:hypothetical protein
MAGSPILKAYQQWYAFSASGHREAIDSRSRKNVWPHGKRPCKTRLAVAELLGVHRHSVGTWLELYEQGGLDRLLTIKKAPGKKPLASPEVVEALKERLHHPEGFRADGEIQAYLA